MAIVTETYYTDTFMGVPLSSTEFPQFEAWAARAVALATRNRVSESNFETLPAYIQTAYMDAICYQICYLVEEGLTSALNGVSEKSFTVGKVRVDTGGASAHESGRATSICSAALACLEQTGLLNPQVDVLGRWCL